MNMDSMVVGVGGTRFRQKLERIPMKQRYSLRIFQRANEALYFILQNQPRLIVVDYRLSDIDGLSFLYRVRRLAPNSIRILCGVDSATQRLTSAALNLFACIDAGADTEGITNILNRALSTLSKHNEEILLSNSRRMGEWHAPITIPSSVSAQIQ